METSPLVALAICLFISYSIVFFGRYIILEIMARSYCSCGHEFNDHWVVPKGYGYLAEHSSEKCKICKCKKFTRDENNPKTTPPIKFWPR